VKRGLFYLRKEVAEFESVIKNAMIACEAAGDGASHHFTGVSKMVKPGSGAVRKVKGYYLSRLACYIIARAPV
jgi:DNA-damage-inducible protein D